MKKPEPCAPNPHYFRYSDQKFPAYRYIPSINNHPVRHPQGHSYGRVEEKAEFIAPAHWQRHSLYLYGVDLYNFSFWWESHEAWETLWHLTAKHDVYGQFLQGLIQISAAFIKWYSEQHDGMSRLFRIGRQRLEFVAGITPVFMGVDLKKHLQMLDQHFAQVLEKEPEVWPDLLENYPFLCLQNVEITPHT